MSAAVHGAGTAIGFLDVTRHFGWNHYGALHVTGTFGRGTVVLEVPGN